MNRSQGPMAQVKRPVSQQPADAGVYRKSYPHSIPTICSFEGCSSITGYLTPGVELAPDAKPLCAEHAKLCRRPAPEIKRSSGIHRGALNVFLDTTHRSHGSGYTRSGVWMLLKEPERFIPIADRVVAADPSKMPRWNSGQGVNKSDLRTHYGKDVPREVYSVSLAHALAVTEDQGFDPAKEPAPFEKGRRRDFELEDYPVQASGGLPEPTSVTSDKGFLNDMNAGDFDNGFRAFNRIDPTEVKRGRTWWMPKPGDSQERRQELAQQFFTILWRRAAHTKEQRGSYNRWVWIAQQFWQERQSPAMIARNSHGELSVSQVKNIVQRLRTPPKELRI